MPSQRIGLLTQRDAAFPLQHAQRGEGIGHDCGLRILGQRQVRFRPLRHDAEEMLPQRLVDFLEKLARDGRCRRKGRPHANSLTALPRKDECAHSRDPLSMKALRPSPGARA